jgi:hypothetical protein
MMEFRGCIYVSGFQLRAILPSIGKILTVKHLAVFGNVFVTIGDGVGN